MTWDGPLSSNEGMTLTRPPRPPELLLITGSGLPPIGRTTQGKSGKVNGLSETMPRARHQPGVLAKLVSFATNRFEKELLAKCHAELSSQPFFKPAMRGVHFIGGECPVRCAICQRVSQRFSIGRNASAGGVRENVE